MNERTKRITTIGMLAALAFAAMAIGRVPVVLFLKYDPKDIIIAIGGLAWGPMTSFLVSLVVSLVEMLTLSDTGPIGMVMNLLSSCAFCCTAALIYKKHRSLKGAIIGLLCGWLTMVVVMLLWNYLITPIYMSTPREKIAEMLIPYFLPFNLLKGGINAAVTILIYKPVVTALRKAGLVEQRRVNGAGAKIAEPQAAPKANTGVILVALLVLASGVLLILSFQGII